MRYPLAMVWWGLKTVAGIVIAYVTGSPEAELLPKRPERKKSE